MNLGPKLKAVVAGIGTTITAAATAWATVELALADGNLGVDEVGTVIGALVAAGGTVYGVWKVRNRPAVTLPADDARVTRQWLAAERHDRP